MTLKAFLEDLVPCTHLYGLNGRYWTWHDSGSPARIKLEALRSAVRVAHSNCPRPLQDCAILNIVLFGSAVKEEIPPKIKKIKRFWLFGPVVNEIWSAGKRTDFMPGDFDIAVICTHPTDPMYIPSDIQWGYDCSAHFHDGAHITFLTEKELTNGIASGDTVCRSISEKGVSILHKDGWQAAKAFGNPNLYALWKMNPDGSWHCHVHHKKEVAHVG